MAKEMVAGGHPAGVKLVPCLQVFGGGAIGVDPRLFQRGPDTLRQRAGGVMVGNLAFMVSHRILPNGGVKFHKVNRCWR